MRRHPAPRMKIRVLGSAAGGGYPQWNCNCRNCAGLRGGTLRSRGRTQSSIAVRAYQDFQPAGSPRDTAIRAIVLVDGQVDHTTGLYMLREATRPWDLWCTD